MLNCKDCPYLKTEYDNRNEWYDENEANANISDYYCNKIGQEINLYDVCSEADDDTIDSPVFKGVRKLNKRERYKKHQNKLKRLAKNCHNVVDVKNKRYIRGYGYKPIDNPYYERIYYGKRSKKYYKKLSNKLVRRYKDGISNGNNYRKIFDYAWNID